MRPLNLAQRYGLETVLKNEAGFLQLFDGELIVG
jgi:hypothetical protein